MSLPDEKEIQWKQTLIAPVQEQTHCTQEQIHDWCDAGLQRHRSAG